MYQQLRPNGDKTGFWIVPNQEISKAEACIAFLMRLPSAMFAVFRVEDMLSQNTEKVSKNFEAVIAGDGTPLYENTIFLQAYQASCVISEGCFREQAKTNLPEAYEEWSVAKKDVERIISKHNRMCEAKRGFCVDYSLSKGEERVMRRFHGNYFQNGEELYLRVRATEPEEVLYLQEELFLEKARKELVSSLSEGWIYEYNIGEGAVTTISKEEQDCSPETEKREKIIVSLEDVHPDDKTKLLACSRAIAEEGKMPHAEVRVRCGDTYRWISLATRMLYAADGTPVSVIGKLSDIDEKKKEEIRLREEASKDSLTGLLNRAAFRERAELLLAAEEKKQCHRLAVLFFDVDSFKLVNDRYGHLYGDTVLLMMAETMREMTSEGDLLGRFGGDEFTIMLHDYKSEEQLIKQMEQIRSMFSTLCAADNEAAKISCSIGAALYGKDGVDLTELLSNADKALYYVKESGCGVALCTPEIQEIFYAKQQNRLTEESILPGRFLPEEITEFALNLLEGSKDLKSAIHMLLTKVGRRFELSSVTVREENEMQNHVLSYYWKDEKKAAGITDLISVSPKEQRQMIHFLKENGMIEISDLSEISKDNPLYRVCMGKGIKALLQYPLFAEGEVFGQMSFVDCVQNRVWKKEERHSLNVISKIVGNYLARERAYRKIEQKVEMMKSYDEITGLLRYDKFKEVAQNILETSNDRVRYAVVSTDISHFKYFNEIYGFQNGDEVLTDFANLVVKHNPRAVTACRDYADNFIIMVTVSSPESLLHNVQNYNRTFVLNQSEKFLDSNLEVCSGAYIIDQPEEGILRAIDNANIARKLVKKRGTSGILMFEPGMKENHLKDIALQHMLREAIEEEEFCVFLQPKVSLVTGELVGAEALSRWKRCNGTYGMPGEFVPTLENSGKIIELDYFIYTAVLKILRNWKMHGLKQIPISVNFSRVHLKSPLLPDYLVRRLKQYEVDSSLIEIEITESAFIEDQEAMIQKVRAIKGEGFNVSIDDFGTGYSSLSMLTKLPADIVKLDREFLQNEEKASAKDMLYNVIHLIKDNHMSVICEGVETAEQAEFLVKAGCDMGQGYYFSQPLPVHEFEEKYLLRKAEEMQDGIKN